MHNLKFNSQELQGNTVEIKLRKTRQTVVFMNVI